MRIQGGKREEALLAIANSWYKRKHSRRWLLSNHRIIGSESGREGKLPQARLVNTRIVKSYDCQALMLIR